MKTVILIFLCVFAACSVGLSSDVSKPNVLFIAVDDLRLQANVFGQTQMVTPGLDMLASEATVFKKAYCSVPVCGASRASLMSGARPAEDRFWNYYARKDRDLPDVPSLARWFKEAGYRTTSNGKIYHFSDDDIDAWSEPPFMPEPKGLGGHQQGYLKEESLRMAEANRNPAKPGVVIGPATEGADVPDNAYPDGALADKVIEDLQSYAQTGEPFFLGVGFWKPHLPYIAPKKYWDLYDAEEIVLADNPYKPIDAPDASMHHFGELRNMYADTPLEGPVSDDLARRLIHGYYACVSYVDAQIQKLLVTLEETGLAENTIIVLWGDHGYHLGEHGLWCKHATFDRTMNAPLIVKVPWIEGGVETLAITEFVDIYPTLCELADLPMPSHLDGKSFVSELENPDHYFKDYAYSRYHWGEAIIIPNFLYSEWKDKERETYARMLFDHRNDPKENQNVAEDPKYAEIVKYMGSLIDEARTLRK